MSGDYTMLNTSATISKRSCCAAVQQHCTCSHELQRRVSRCVVPINLLHSPSNALTRPSERPGVAWHVASRGSFTYDTQEK
uniref:Uncharacterized protein n=1 Tax=Hyaloperonospora arabidopsidis (strain Emoy2) TaxID=559515 RepID=M4BXM7_HYAAE